MLSCVTVPWLGEWRHASRTGPLRSVERHVRVGRASGPACFCQQRRCQAVRTEGERPHLLGIGCVFVLAESDVLLLLLGPFRTRPILVGCAAAVFRNRDVGGLACASGALLCSPVEAHCPLSTHGRLPGRLGEVDHHCSPLVAVSFFRLLLGLRRAY